jgi:hypothetical protein
LVSREFVHPFATWTFDTALNVVGAKKELLDLRCCEFVIVPNSKVCWGRGALGVGDDFGSAFLLRNSIHGPACLRWIVRNTSNMPEFLVDFRFLDSSDTAKIQTRGRGWGNLEHRRRGLLDDGRQGWSMRPYGSLSNTKAREVEGVRAVGLIISSNGGVRLAFVRAEDLGTLKVGTTSTEFVDAFKVEYNLL